MKLSNIQIQKYTITQIQKYTNTQYTNMQIHTKICAKYADKKVATHRDDFAELPKAIGPSRPSPPSPLNLLPIPIKWPWPPVQGHFPKKFHKQTKNPIKCMSVICPDTLFTTGVTAERETKWVAASWVCALHICVHNCVHIFALHSFKWCISRMKSAEEQPYCIVYRTSHGRELIWVNI